MGLSEVKVVLPGKFNYDACRKELFRAEQNIIRGMAKDYENVTRTWRHKPRIVGGESGRKVSVEQAVIKVVVGPDPADDNSRIFGYVDRGTRPHIIRPRRAKALVFAWGGPGSYSPKTRPGFLYSFRGGGPSGPIVFRKFVRHPGTKPRDITENIQRKWQALSHREASDAVVRAARASGHSFR